MASHNNLKEAIINGLIAIREVLHAISLKPDEDIDNAAKNIKRQAKIAAHYAIAHLNQGGKALLPMSQAAREQLLWLLQARIYGTPKSLKSIAGGGISSTGQTPARPVSVAAPKHKVSKPAVERRHPSPPIIRAASEERSPPIHVSEEDWKTKKRRRLDLKTAQRVGLDATKAVLFCARLADTGLFQANLKALVADSILAARSAISYLESGGRRLRTPSPAERRALRTKLEAAATGRLEAMVPEVEAPEPEKTGDGLDDVLSTIARGVWLLRDCVEEPRISLELADALGSIVRGALLSRDCMRKHKLFFETGGRNASASRSRR